MADTNAMSRFELKRVLEELRSVKGRNTELVSIYVPSGYNMQEIINMLAEEQSEAQNIKSKQTRKNVTAALEKIERRLKEDPHTPENGVALFAGNASEREGKPDYQLWEVVPPEPIGSRIYHCDKTFHLEPLENMVIEKERFGIIILDKNNAVIASLRGKHTTIHTTMDSQVPGKTGQGGQCLPADTFIPLPNGELKRIAEMDENHKHVTSADFDQNTLTAAKHNSVFASQHKEYYTLKTHNPKREISATGNHRLFVFSNGEVKEKFVEDIQPGDMLLGMRNLSIEGKTQTFDMDTPYKLLLTGDGAEKLKEHREEAELPQQTLGEQIGVTQTAISKFEQKERNPSPATLEALLNALEIDENTFLDTFCEKEQLCDFPDTLNEDFAQFLGYFQGDGYLDGNRLEFYEEREEIAEHYAALFKRLFDLEPTIKYREDKNYYRIRVYSRALVERLKTLFPAIFTHSAEAVPAQIQKSPDNILSAYIRGFFDAEGSATDTRITIATIEEELMEQLHLLLHRFGITASIAQQTINIEQLEGEKQTSEQACIEISDTRSLKNFQERIGFTAEDKQDTLTTLIDGRSNKSRSDKIPFSGKEIRRLAEQVGMTTGDFPQFNPYFRDEKTISYNRFKRGILPVFKEQAKALDGKKAEECQQIVEMLEGVAEGDILLLKIAEKNKHQLDIEQEFYDIDVPEYRNFVADSIIVHNSAQRFARIRKQMFERFMNDIAEKAKNAFFDAYREGNLQGIIVAGPGFAKEQFVDDGYLHPELAEKVIAQIGTNYANEGALSEVMDKAEELLEETAAAQERELVNRFFEHLKKDDGLATYGLRPVAKAIQMGAVDTLLLSEDLDMVEATVECNNCGHEQTEQVEQGDVDSIDCGECGSTTELVEKENLIDLYGRKAQNIDSAVEIISTSTAEGKRLKEMGGIAAILRYRIE